MALFVNILQLVIAAVLSCAAAILLGPMAYIIVGALVTFTCLVLLTDVAREDETDGDDDESVQVLRVVAATLSTSIVFGVIWPTLPLIFAWGAWRDRVRGVFGEK